MGASAHTCARTVGFCALATLVGLTLFGLALVGCVPPDPSGEDTLPEQVLSATPTPPPGDGITTPESGSDQTASTPPSTPGPQSDPARHVENEPNDTWSQAETVAFNGGIELAGTMAAGENVRDIDMFDLGPAYANQRLEVDFTVSGGTNVQIGLFDAQGRILAYVDPISPTAGPDRVDIILHEYTETLYAVITTRSSSTSTRSYTAQINLSAGNAPVARPQNVVLVFGGASQVRIGSRAAVDVPPFDIAAVNPEFEGRTEEAIQLLMEMVREDYDGLNISFYRDTDAGLPEGELTYIYFGTSDNRLLGLADNIDPYNSDPGQAAILYTDTFSLFNQLEPGFEATVQVLANVTSHETGHLLGLRHTADAEELMDVTASARKMLMDQWFKSDGLLHSSVLPVGVQDAPSMLSRALGGSLKPTTTFKFYARAKATVPGDPEKDFYLPRSLLADCGCVECNHEAEE